MEFISHAMAIEFSASQEPQVAESLSKRDGAVQIANFAFSYGYMYNRLGPFFAIGSIQMVLYNL